MSCKHELDVLKLRHEQLKEEYKEKLTVLKQQNWEQSRQLIECKKMLGDQVA